MYIANDTVIMTFMLLHKLLIVYIYTCTCSSALLYAGRVARLWTSSRIRLDTYTANIVHADICIPPAYRRAIKFAVNKF